MAESEAVHRLGWPAEQTHMLVIGSTQPTSRVPGHKIDRDWGSGLWLKGSRLLGLAMQAQMSLTQDWAHTIIGAERVSVVYALLTAEEPALIGLNKSTEKAANALRTLAGTVF